MRDPRAKLRVACARERRVGTALLRPRRQQRREERRARAVRVLVERRARVFDEREQRLDQRLVRERLQVREMERRARAACDLDHLPDRLENAAALVADVRHDRRAELGRDLGDGDELVRVRVRAREVDEPERQHARTGLEREAHLAAHLVEPRRHALAADDEVPHRAVPDRRHERHRRPRRVERVEVLGEARPRPLRRPSPSSARRYARRARQSATGAGARPSGQITSVVKPCRIFGASSGSSNGASAECACRSMKPGQSIAPVRVEHVAVEPVADRDDPPVGDADVRAEGRAVARVDLRTAKTSIRGVS